MRWTVCWRMLIRGRPAQSNFSGVKHPLDLVARAKSGCWDVLLDATAFVPLNRLELSAVEPDFVSVSFYKMFGYPTGVGALLVRRSAIPKLKRPWFAGGKPLAEAYCHSSASDVFLRATSAWWQAMMRLTFGLDAMHPSRDIDILECARRENRVIVSGLRFRCHPRFPGGFASLLPGK